MTNLVSGSKFPLFVLFAICLVATFSVGCGAKKTPADEAKASMEELLKACQKQDAEAARKFLDGKSMADNAVKTALEGAQKRGTILSPDVQEKLRSVLERTPEVPMFQKTPDQLDKMLQTLTTAAEGENANIITARADNGREKMIYQLERKGAVWMVVSFKVDKP
ncbi:MAG TPA: hypothetical protein PKM25_00745 [Candidatus Ozemobacteraceae bacterium]|nr:hypothetical protein [Candidatus Ozemobacteraceae bacterium]